MKNEVEKVKSIIKNEIEEIVGSFGLELDKIILFGSRARGDYSEYSDWDILVILKNEIPFDAERKLSKEIRKRLAEFLIPCDIIIRTPNEIERFKEYINSVTKTAIEEGIAL